MKKIHVQEIGPVIDEFDKKLLIVGQPKGVGLTTELCYYFAKKLFFDESFSLFVVTGDIRDKIFIADTITKFLFDNYGYETFFNYEKNVLYVYNNFVGVVIDSEMEQVVVDSKGGDLKLDCVYIDKHINNDVMNYYLLDFIPSSSKIGIVSTYDTEDSIFYAPDTELIEKIIVHSERSKKQTKSLKDKDSYTIGYEKIIKGEFENEKD